MLGVEKLTKFGGGTLPLEDEDFEVTPQGEIVWEYVSPFQWNRGTAMVESGIYRSYRYGYDRVPQADPRFMQTDGHLGVPGAEVTLPPNLGLPSDDLP